MKSQVFGCPSCQQPFQVLAEQAGQIVQCPSCAQTVEIPASAFADETESTTTGDAKATIRGPVGPEMVSKCKHCQGQFGISAEMYGTQVACPHCQQAVEIQNPETDVPEINIDTATKPGNSSATNQYEISQQNPVLDDPGSPKQTAGSASAAKVPAKQSIENLLPPTVARTDPGKSKPSRKHAKEDVGQLKEENNSPTKSAKDQANDTQPDPIAHLMPPRFDVADPTRIRVSGSRPDHKILLPDGAGGLKQVDERIIQVEHDGQKVSLVALTPQQRRRRRLITNAIAIFLGITIMAIAFSMLT